MLTCSPRPGNKGLEATLTVMDVHPLTLLTLAYAGDDLQQVDQLLVQVRQELETVAKKSDTP